ncbi:MAG: DEAD/DEAH box helicase [Pseudomonadota bacterium]
MQYTLDDIRRNFDSGTYNRGRAYAQKGYVRTVNVDEVGIQSKVEGSGGQLYRQSIVVIRRRNGIGFDGDCSCPMDHNCKHVVAVLLAGLDRHGAAAAADIGPPLPYALVSWLDLVRETAATATAAVPAKSQAGQRLMYVLVPDGSGVRLKLHLSKTRARADGSIASATIGRDTASLLNNPPAYASSADIYTLRLFASMFSYSSYGVAVTEPRDETGNHFLRHVLDEGNLGWAEATSAFKAGAISPVAAGPARAARLGWSADGQTIGSMRLAWLFDDGEPVHFILPTKPPMYLHDYLLGELVLGDTARTVPMARLMTMVERAPPVAAGDAAGVARQLAAQGLAALVPVPPARQRITRDDIRARPLLVLGSLSAAAPGRGEPHLDDYVVLGFDYDGERVVAGSAEELARHVGAATELIARDLALETAAGARLAALGLRGDAGGGSLPVLLQLANADDWLRFAREGLPRLRADGWIIEQGAGFPFDLAEVDEWYAEVADGAESSPWFDLELGIVVDGGQVPLLPVLLEMIRSAPQEFDAAALAGHPDGDLLFARLPGGARVALPWGRVKPILAALGELFFNEHIGKSVRLPTLDAARLAELEASVQLRWTGGAQLRAMGEKLRTFGGVQAVPAPLGLQASLRPYQSAGLAWMQFLREFGFAGILADDMGLGKTIQTLAHILLEKEAGRLTAPALVVAPTSLMGNWQAEAARFAPGLRVLLLHGPERLGRFDQVGQHDLVLTTYALLPRDEARLRAHSFHLLILDESQYVKNSRSKAAQTAALLTARHRLCLTGTPLQNHLGELWAQFHFLMPGLLGDEKAFNANFRKPIEKLGDGGRNAFLVRRIKPFLLRRTKDAVAKELPPKTEMVREVELAGAQRDLYETVRLAMDRKVREAIASKGVARSQIVILDALLKLRQVCCDPRLVKSAGARAAGAPSAKLDELMEMIVTLLDEGRKILVFSQFTSMLALIEAELRQRAIAYALLTGDTVDRAGQVAAFQQGAVPLFLISLKAGGVGLNLTAADTVIHYDPWWNPAAENQATDRAWRIGQDKPVFVYKLIARGTLEEKIQQLQRRKAGLAGAVLAGDGAGDLALTQADLQAILAPLGE